MKRYFNYTNRVKIFRSAVDVRLYNDKDGVQAFTAKLNLVNYRKVFPVGARVYLEAYYRTALMRFPMGEIEAHVAHLELTERLTELHEPQVNFRIKVVDESGQFGRIIGIVDRLRVINQDSQQMAQVGLLPVRFEDLGAQIWRVDLPEDGSEPMLCINSTLDPESISPLELVRSDPVFHALVFPEVVRRVLEHLLLNEAMNDDEDPDSWQSGWKRFASLYAAEKLSSDADEAETREWIASVAESFATALNLKQNLEQYFREMNS